MGIQDRDWWREAQKERERKEDRARRSSQPKSWANASATKTGLIPMMLFWCAVMGLLYVLMTHYLKPKPMKVATNGDLVITRSHDGHFYVAGTVNGKVANFMVDTGATLVSVSDEFANQALLQGGEPTTFKTANGDRPGRVVTDVAVSVGPVTVPDVRVGIGLTGDKTSDALLGQSFLSRFDVMMSKDQMVLRPRL
ncbi:retropepsin-like aspartic protease family protein [Rhodoferax antarcticus]|uniref:retropepsin-like aspartic protease family protein n=1 Tax=Rhodoferax antarcticus TaxID=81479 RepID=UPI0009F8924E|nr:retropepsin-like aspartic protease [Rhodoferax antarcticus]MCW2314404.1 aspartyl protease family protein [Rhodoferax antarcticus]